MPAKTEVAACFEAKRERFRVPARIAFERIHFSPALRKDRTRRNAETALAAPRRSGASRFAIGIVVVMGMRVGTFFTLFVLPTIYSFVAGEHRAEAESPRTKALAEAGV